MTRKYRVSQKTYLGPVKNSTCPKKNHIFGYSRARQTTFENFLWDKGNFLGHPLLFNGITRETNKNTIWDKNFTLFSRSSVIYYD